MEPANQADATLTQRLTALNRLLWLSPPQTTTALGWVWKVLAIEAPPLASVHSWMREHFPDLHKPGSNFQRPSSSLLCRGIEEFTHHIVRIYDPSAEKAILLTQLKKIRMLYFQNSPPIKLSSELHLEMASSGFFEGIEKPTQLKSLTIGRFTRLALGTPLPVLPRAMNQLTQLEDLYLANVKLQPIASSLTVFKNLTRLSLRDGDLTEIPTEIGELTKLEFFDCGANVLQTLPLEIGKLTRLKNLFFDHNPITALPATLGNLTALEELGCDCWEKSLLPMTLTQCVRLQWIWGTIFLLWEKHEGPSLEHFLKEHQLVSIDLDPQK